MYLLIGGKNNYFLIPIVIFLLLKVTISFSIFFSRNRYINLFIFWNTENDVDNYLYKTIIRVS